MLELEAVLKFLLNLKYILNIHYDTKLYSGWKYNRRSKMYVIRCYFSLTTK